ncbi:tyrosine-type recombinase/integrase [Deefgea chitinilytica]|uniref:Tyrosine-type recombinase/integrase n=2 Tax=Chitinibacteraceae TaxID=2897177 RepID=A0ABS2CEZ9_9NEIS|nr:tyrosine-type recombinase/integrase [Deefgea chitinilytica]
MPNVLILLSLMCFFIEKDHQMNQQWLINGYQKRVSLMAGISKSDNLSVLALKKKIGQAQEYIASGLKSPPCKIACGFGLSLWVMGDSGYWKLPYRYQGKQKTISLGVCNLSKPDLADARARALKAKEMLADGVEPTTAKKAREEKVAAELYQQENTFEAVARAWHKKEVKSGTWIPSHAERIMKRLIADIFPIIGNRAVDSLATHDLLQPLTFVAQRGTYNLAKAYRQYITVIMRYAVQIGRIKSNPALDLQGAIPTRKPVNRPALPLSELAELMSRINAYQGLVTVKTATKFALLTGARSSEFRFARWTEFDLDKAIWTIPGEREEVEGVPNSVRGEKMRRERIIYLSHQAIELITLLRKLNGDAVFVFQGRKLGTPISENTVNNMLKKIGYNTASDICLHGFRTMMVSSLNESNRFSRDAIERHIGHEGGSGNRVEQIYKRNALYLAERQRMLQWWADYLDANSQGRYIPPDEFSNAAIGMQAIYVA